MRKILKDGFEELNLELSENQIDKFEKFHELLSEKNKVMNLTAITGEEDTARLHFLDCSAVLNATDFRNKTVIDIGTGAGFPGMPLIIACPEIEKITLLDSLNKRINFLSECVEELDISNAYPIHARAEDAVEHREVYDIAVSRAVARLNLLCELCLPFVKVGGVFIAMKGPKATDELSEVENALEILGGEIISEIEYKIPQTDIIHTLVLIKKIKPTPSKYPRKFSTIKKSPL